MRAVTLEKWLNSAASPHLSVLIWLYSIYTIHIYCARDLYLAQFSLIVNLINTVDLSTKQLPLGAGCVSSLVFATEYCICVYPHVNLSNLNTHVLASFSLIACVLCCNGHRRYKLHFIFFLSNLNCLIYILYIKLAQVLEEKKYIYAYSTEIRASDFFFLPFHYYLRRRRSYWCIYVCVAQRETVLFFLARWIVSSRRAIE